MICPAAPQMCVKLITGDEDDDMSEDMVRRLGEGGIRGMIHHMGDVPRHRDNIGQDDMEVIIR